MNRNILIGSAALLLAVTGMATADTEPQEIDAISGCEITKTTTNGMIKLESHYGDEKAGTGSYKMSVRTLSGSNNVNSTQRGRFAKKAGEAVLLSKAQLSAHGQSYEVKLNVKFNGKSHKCSKKIHTST